MNTTLCVAALFLLCSVNGFKVLVYSPRFGDSHVVFMGKVADILVDEEMDVTVLLPILNSRCNSNGTKLAKTLIIDPDPRVTERFKSSFFLSQVWRSSQANPLAQKAGFDFIRDAHVEQCESNLKQKELLKFLETEEFDLGISEVFDLCGLAIFEAIGLKKHVIMQTALMPEKVGQIFGAANLPAVVPAYFSHTGNDMTYIGRIFNLCQSFISCWFTTSVGHGIEEVYTKEFGQKVDLYKKIQEASFVITNTDPLIDFPRPSSERIINIGGIGVPEPKPLNAYWEKVVTARKTTVLISFGTVAQSQLMPEEIKSTFLKTFKRFQNITFIWKYEGDLSGLAKNYTNVVTHKWVPQNDLLNHPNLKLFITHAGMNSILETCRRGVPLIAIPLFADQMRNAEAVKRLGNSLLLDKSELYDVDVLEASIREILDNERFQNNASVLSKMIKNRPRDLKAELVNYVKFAAEFGSPQEFRFPQVSFVQYYMLDIFVPLIAVCIFISLGIVRVVAKLVGWVIDGQRVKAKTL